jgi:hypothetical protein
MPSFRLLARRFPLLTSHSSLLTAIFNKLCQDFPPASGVWGGGVSHDTPGLLTGDERASVPFAFGPSGGFGRGV